MESNVTTPPTTTTPTTPTTKSKRATNQSRTTGTVVIALALELAEEATAFALRAVVEVVLVTE